MTAVPDPWWRHAVFYEVYVRSFADGTGDGVGDLRGVRSRLPYLRDLGVDGVWLTPFYPSPMADGGYDIADHRDVDPAYGDLAELDLLLDDAHALGLRIAVDIVPNHCSSAAPWFQEAVASAPASAARGRFLFRDGRGPDGDEPPNNWESDFGGPAWTRLPDGQWYLHLFDSAQPDFDWRQPEVREEFEDVLRFWLDRGVDGLRIDVASALLKHPDLPDNPPVPPPPPGVYRPVGHQWDQPEVHEVYRSWRRLVDGYAGDRMLIGEAWVVDHAALARYVRPDELHQAFNFHFLQAQWSADSVRDAVEGTLVATGSVGASPTWVLSNHDVVRPVTRYGGGATGLRRARAAALLMLALPGSAYVYQGEELGLPEVLDLPDDALQDPTWERSGHTRRGRDGCRVPLPWRTGVPSAGFCDPGATPWLPQPAGWDMLSVQAQLGDPASTLALFRDALHLRSQHLGAAAGPLEWLDSPADVVAFRRDGVTCTTTFGASTAQVPRDAELLLASAPLGADRALGPDTTAWWRA